MNLLNIQAPFPELKACVNLAPSGTQFWESITCDCSGLGSREMWGIKQEETSSNSHDKEQLESCGGAGCSKGWWEVYGHPIPLGDLWTPDAGCYLLLGGTETYCCELPTPPPLVPAPCAAGAQQRRENPGACRIKGKEEPKRSCFFYLVWAQSYFWNRGTRFRQAENIPLLFTESLSHFVTRSPV